MRKPLLLLFLLSASALLDAPPEAVVGSRHSDVYHRPTCANAHRIRRANLVSWASAAEARRAGYRPGQVCFRTETPE